MPIDPSIGTRLAAVPEITATTQRDAAGAELDVVCQLAMDAARALVAEATALDGRVEALEEAPAGSVQTVNGVEPDGDGDVELSAEDIGAADATDTAAALSALDGRVSDLESAPGGGAVSRTLTAVFDGGAVDGTPESVRVATVVELRAPYALTLTGWTLLLHAATGSVTVEVRTKPFASGSFASITDSSPPSTTGGANAEGGVTGWTTSVSAGHLVQFEITARIGLVPRVTLQIQATQA